MSKMTSTNIFLGLSLVLLMTGSKFAESTPEENFAFETFVMVNLRNYSTWLVSSELDPTPVITTLVETSDVWDPLWNISGKLWNQTIFNHSSIFSWDVKADLDKMDLIVHLDFRTNVVTYTGEYWAGGVTHDNPISGSGNFQIIARKSDWSGGPYLDVKFGKFEVTPEGFVNLSVSNVTQEYVAVHSGTYEGLSAGGEEDKVGSSLGVGHGKQFGDWSPLAKYLEAFLQTKFAETSFADIVGSS